MDTKKKEIKKYMTLTRQNIRNLAGKMNWRYIAIGVIILLGMGLLVVSYWIPDADIKNIMVGLGTGVVTSAMVTLWIEIVNAQIEIRKIAKYKTMLLNPLADAVKRLYVQMALNVNEYRTREGIKNWLLLPLEDTKGLLDFFREMNKVDIESIGDEKKRKRLDEFISLSLVAFKEVITQYEGLQFEILRMDNIITQNEYDSLKNYTNINECKKRLNILNDKTLSDKEKYYASVQLMYNMMEFLNGLMHTLDFIKGRIEKENEWIKVHLQEIYVNEVYIYSDEYYHEELARAEAEEAYYAEHPEILEEFEQSEE